MLFSTYSKFILFWSILKKFSWLNWYLSESRFRILFPSFRNNIFHRPFSFLYCRLTVDRQPSGGRILSTLLSNEKRSKFNGCSSIDRHHPYFFLLKHKYYQLREVKNNLGDVTKAHFIALSMFDIYSETKNDRILLPQRRVWPTQHHPDLTADI